MKNKYRGEMYKEPVVLKSEDDPRRHKSKCVFYQKGYCLKLLHNCTGSTRCDYYSKKKIVEDDYLDYLTGSFTIKYLETGKTVVKHIRKDISLYDDLTLMVLKNKVGAKFKYEFGENVKIINKNIKFKL